MFTPTMSLSYAQDIQEAHLRRTQSQRLSPKFQSKGLFQNSFIATLADLLITSGQSIKQRYQTA
jgi:hypothetical protein